MRVLILGGAGMLGHKLVQVLGSRFETWATVRELDDRLRATKRFDPARTLTGVTADSFDSIVHAFARVRPDAVINCIGVVKQRPDAKLPITSLRINALLPHQLAELSAATGARLIHISTDCVFAGTKGQYVETDAPDATDLYGRSKLLGEVTEGGALTVRTSIIGRELTSRQGLVEWFLSNRGGSVEAYKRAIFSGLPTVELAHVIGDILENHRDLAGLYHVGADPIDKYELLRLVNEAFATGIELRRNDAMIIDRSLDSSRFRSKTGFVPKPWPALVASMAADAASHG